MNAFRGGRMDESGESSRPHVVRFERDVVDVDPVEVDQRKLPEEQAEIYPVASLTATPMTAHRWLIAAAAHAAFRRLALRGLLRLSLVA